MNRTRTLFPAPGRPAPTVRRRYASRLRALSLLLALCCFWSFAGAGVAIAAVPDHGKTIDRTVSHPFPKAPAFRVGPSPFASSPQSQVSPPPAALPPAPTVTPPVWASSSMPVPETTLLNEMGHLARSVSPAESAAWGRELKSSHPGAHRAAQLHLWLGEALLGRDQQPGLAGWHFRTAKAAASLTDPLHFLAAYDGAVALTYAGAYIEADGAFSHLLAVRNTAHGFDRARAALWLRHVRACAGYHAAHAAQGIPEPPRLDPLCAAAAMAACLRSLVLPYDRKTLLAACRVTGEGSTLRDVLDAGPRLGVRVRALTADDRGLIALPKPLVAYVEHDHFVALTRADAKGVSYLCSDCGAWPGGRVDLTWAQWHTMNGGLYAAVTLPGSRWDRTLDALAPRVSRLQVAATRLGGLLPRRVEGAFSGLPLLRGHIVLDSLPAGTVSCGSAPPALFCTMDSHHPTDHPAALHGPSGGDPVDLATGQEEYMPDPDLTVYNPVGPSVTWRRTYQTLRGPGQSYPDWTYDAAYQSDDFGTGWSQPYNVGVIVNGSARSVLFANSGKIGFTFSGTPTGGHPLMGTPARSGVPLLLQWDYDGTASGHYEVVFKDRTRWITGSAFAPGSVLPLAQIADRNGNSIYFNYPTVSASKASNGWPLLGSITTGPSGTGTVLLSVARNTTAGSDGRVDSYVTSVTDHPGTPAARTVFYQAARLTNPNCPAQYSPYYSELTGVSQIVPGGTASGAPSRWAYGYKPIPNGEGAEQINCLHTITTPSPTGSGTATASLWYMTDNTADANGSTNPNYFSGAAAPFVGALVDANGNRRLYSTSDGALHPSGGAGIYSQVVVQNGSGSTLYSYQVGYDSNLNETARTDGAGRAISTLVYSDANSPYSPSQVLDGNANRASLLPSAQPGTSLTFATVGSDHPASPNTWQILNGSGSSVATSSAPNGWSFTPTAINGGASYTLTVTSPSSAPVGQYEARAQITSGTVSNGVQRGGASPQGGPGGTGPTPTITYASAYFALQSLSNPALGVTNCSYDPYGNVLTETSPRQTATTYTYSYANFALGELTQVQEGTNLSQPKAPTAYTYFEPSGLIQSVAAPLPGTTNSSQTVVTSYTYDTTSQGNHGLGNLLTITTPGNNTASAITTTYGYTQDGSYSQPAAMGQPLTVTDNLGKVSHLRYDVLGNIIGVKDALGNETDFIFDIRNAPLQTILPATGQTGSGHGGSQMAYLYVEPSALATSQWPVVTLQYGPVVTQRAYDEGNTGAVRQIVSTYGLEGELLTITGSSEPVSYAYDAMYRLKTLTDGGGHTTSYFYNPAGYLSQLVYPGAQTSPPTAPLAAGTADTVTFPAYDADGNTLARVDGNNVTTTYTYSDPESQLTAITYPAGTIGSVTLGYDNYGRRSVMSDGTGRQSYAYDDEDGLISKIVTWTGLAAKTVSYGYYPDGSRQTMAADSRVFSYGYDAVGRMNSLTNNNSEITTYSYQDNGWLKTKTLANGVIVTFTRDAQGRTTDLLNSFGGSTLSDYRVPMTGGYDSVGSRLSVTATIPSAPANYSGTTNFTYDYGQMTNPSLNRSQLTGETSTRATGTWSYGYDGGTSTGPGNPTNFKGQTSTFNANNQLTGSGYGYDGDGNPTNYKGSALVFGPENQMIAYAGTTQTNGYDGDGLRTWKQSNSNKTYFLYDDSQPVSEYNSNGTLIVTNTFGADGFVSRHAAATTFYTFDELGNVSQRLDSNGVVQSSDLYDAYGAKTSTGGADVFGYEAQLGCYTDMETGLLLCTHRFYNPNAGSFLTRNPLDSNGSINLYIYSANTPVNRSTPDGLVGGNPVFINAPQPFSPDGEITNYEEPLLKYPDQTCSDATLEALQHQVDLNCKSARFEGTKSCKFVNSCDSLKAKIMIFLECLAAREEIANVCFKGSTSQAAKGHQIQIKELKKRIEECAKLQAVKKCPCDE